MIYPTNLPRDGRFKRNFQNDWQTILQIRVGRRGRRQVIVPLQYTEDPRSCGCMWEKRWWSSDPWSRFRVEWLTIGRSQGGRKESKFGSKEKKTDLLSWWCDIASSLALNKRGESPNRRLWGGRGREKISADYLFRGNIQITWFHNLILASPTWVQRLSRWFEHLARGGRMFTFNSNTCPKRSEIQQNIKFIYDRT